MVDAETRDKVTPILSKMQSKRVQSSPLAVKVLMDPEDFIILPTVLFNVPDSSECLNDEIFGPVAAIQTAKDTEDAITRAK